ncbi:MAG: hypothetical protein ACKOBW_04305 [Planctomycetota bacterium]
MAVLLWLGLVIYFVYGQRHNVLGQSLQRELQTHGLTGSDAPLEVK